MSRAGRQGRGGVLGGAGPAEDEGGEEGGQRLPRVFRGRYTGRDRLLAVEGGRGLVRLQPLHEVGVQPRAQEGRQPEDELCRRGVEGEVLLASRDPKEGVDRHLEHGEGGADQREPS